MRFPGYEITPVVDGVPEGWKQRNLGEMASILRRGISPKYDDNGKYLVKVIRQANIGKLVHQEMNRDRQAAAVYVVGGIKQLLKKLCVKDRYQEVKAGIVVRYQSEQSDLFLSE